LRLRRDMGLRTPRCGKHRCQSVVIRSFALRVSVVAAMVVETRSLVGRTRASAYWAAWGPPDHHSASRSAANLRVNSAMQRLQMRAAP
jgi:hypothetical protein